MYAARVIEMANAAEFAPDPPGLHAVFLRGLSALGVENALFANFVRHDRVFAACRFMLACDPHWARRYVDERHFEHDPCLLYAARQAEPVRLADLPILDHDQQQVQALTAQAGFAAAVIVPVHAATGHSRASVLCLGSSDPTFFDDDAHRTMMRCARLLALEMHDWWLRRHRHELVARARLTEDDLLLLHHEYHRHSTKQIAAALGLSLGSVNSRFQRLNAKLGVINRRMAAQMAVDCGLILD